MDAKLSDTGYYYCKGQMNFEDRKSFTMSVSGMGYAIQILPVVFALVGLSNYFSLNSMNFNE
jgi:hypothetical protein